MVVVDEEEVMGFNGTRGTRVVTDGRPQYLSLCLQELGPLQPIFLERTRAMDDLQGCDRGTQPGAYLTKAARPSPVSDCSQEEAGL